jgi:hypothetical protein
MANTAAQTFSYADGTHYFIWHYEHGGVRRVARFSILDATKAVSVIAERSFFHPTANT